MWNERSASEWHARSARRPRKAGSRMPTITVKRSVWLWSDLSATMSRRIQRTVFDRGAENEQQLTVRGCVQYCVAKP